MNNIREKKLGEGEIVPISFDFHFIRIFGDKDNMDIIEYFISDFYDIPIEEVTGNIKILPRDLKQDSRLEKSKQVDLLLNLGDKKINIEISNTTSKGRKERDLVYLSKVHGGQLRYKQSYTTIGSSWQLRINNTPCNGGKIRKTYYLINEEDINDIYSEKLRIDNIDLVAASKKEYNKNNEKLVKWCRIIKAKTREEIEKELGEGLMDKESRNKLLEEVEKNSRDEEIIDIYEMYSTHEMEREAEIHEAVDKAVDEAIEKNTKEVEKKQQIKMAKRMLADKFDVEVISKYTDLSKKEIEKL